MTDRPFKPRAADYLDAREAPPVPPTGKGRVVRVHRAKKIVHKPALLSEEDMKKREEMFDALSWGYQ